MTRLCSYSFPQKYAENTAEIAEEGEDYKFIRG
jgi:hypothetical protein